MTAAGHPFAQTNVQLYNQLVAGGRGEAELAAVRRAYELAMALFAGHFRGSGKPFLAHAVGVASILASLDASAELVAAGLLHAAYTEGEFGDGGRGPSDRKRAEVRRAAGDVVEAWVTRYTELPWSDAALPALRARLGGGEAAGDQERQLLLLRLANELEDHLDAQVLYCRDAKHGRAGLEERLATYAELAGRLGQPALAAWLGDAARAIAGAVVPATLASDRRFSYVLAPASHVPRRTLAWRYPITSNAAVMRRWSGLRRRVGRWLSVLRTSR